MLNPLFLIVNLIPMPYWLLMIFLPRHPYTRRLTSGWSAYLLLGVLYTSMLVWSIVLAVVTPESMPPLNFSLEGLTALLGTPFGILIVWTHMLMMDLFAGVWVYQESLRVEAPRLVSGICLFLVLMSGPLGLVVFLIWRSIGRPAKVRVSKTGSKATS